ncbi:MAG: phosphatidate cytidylyltransferase [Promethearchaeota archaeon]
MVNELGFMTDWVAWFWTAFTAVDFFVLAWLMVPVARKVFAAKHEQRWNAVALISMFVAIGVAFLVPLWPSYLLLVYPFSWYFQFWCWLWTGIYFAVSRLREPEEVTLAEPAQIHNFTFEAELRRKSLHLLGLLFLLPYFVINFLFDVIWKYLYPPMEPIATEVEKYNIQHLAYGNGGNGLIFIANGLAFVFICTVIIQVYAEIIRLRWPMRAFPLRKTLHKNKRRCEVDMFAAHVYMAPALLVGMMFLAANYSTLERGIYAMVSVVLVTVFADMSAALVGRKWGRHKWPEHLCEGKSFEGSVAGMVTAYIVSFLFVGPVVGLMAPLVFFLTDIPMSRLELSDNWTTPLVLCVVYAIALPWVAPLVTIVPLPTLPA